VPDKPLAWLATTRRDIRAFPANARRRCGFQPRKVQQGLDPDDWKPMTSVGAGVREIRIRTELAHRVFYVATFDEACTSCTRSRNARRRPRRTMSGWRGIVIAPSSRSELVMRRKNELKVTPSTGNVFRDLGFSAEESEHLLVRADLLLQLQKTLAARELTQVQAARLLHVTQPRVSDLLRGRIDLFSTDSLIDMLARLGVRVRFVLKSARGRVA